MKPNCRYYLLFILIISSGHSYSETVKIGYFILPPHMDVGSKGEAQGASVSYVDVIFKQMGYDVEWVGPMPYMRLMNKIEKGEIDVLPLMQESEKEPHFYFPDHPYYRPQSVFIMKKSHPLAEIRSVDDIRNLKIGFIAGVEPSPFIQAHLQELSIEYLPQQNWLELNLMKLQRSRIDAIYDLNQISALLQARKMGMEDDLKILSLPEPVGEMFIGISKKSALSKRIIKDYNRLHDNFKVEYEDLLADELHR
ncbi:transporter substrate-binding domain-containing protein [Motilimonas cestriensis]|uniref:Transporter substrate-binding domain-containing protein n=1 Tax=Motilimonas cestriensis TaxID=2742685 RepID=A0ABS8WFS2_9GAMM|nr:transporter substrate-binding domain-containing protein [Motilimonas cestriensis]MCE2596404.1 transporter substrate-binding domain-containing protein [Motilimonas cestriensis]